MVCQTALSQTPQLDKGYYF